MRISLHMELSVLQTRTRPNLLHYQGTMLASTDSGFCSHTLQAAVGLPVRGSINIQSAMSPRQRQCDQVLMPCCCRRLTS